MITCNKYITHLRKHIVHLIKGGSLYKSGGKGWKTFEKLTIGRGDDCSAPQNISTHHTRFRDNIFFIPRFQEFLSYLPRFQDHPMSHLAGNRIEYVARD